MCGNYYWCVADSGDSRNDKKWKKEQEQEKEVEL
jgi:hypothetical protein